MLYKALFPYFYDVASRIADIFYKNHNFPKKPVSQMYNMKHIASMLGISISDARILVIKSNVIHGIEVSTTQAPTNPSPTKHAPIIYIHPEGALRYMRMHYRKMIKKKES